MKYRLIVGGPGRTVTLAALIPGSRKESPKVLLRVMLPLDDPRDVEVPIGVTRHTLRRRLAQAGCLTSHAEQTKLLDMIVDFVGEAIWVTKLFTD